MNAFAFNQKLHKWDVSNVTNMQAMFKNAYTFNGQISNWNVEKVYNMFHMFVTMPHYAPAVAAGYKRSSFNCDISKWNLKTIFVDNAPALHDGTDEESRSYVSYCTECFGAGKVTSRANKYENDDKWRCKRY